jgi:hypothetical protein
MTDKNVNPKSTRNANPPPDTLNEAIGVPTRREVDPRILAPVIEALGNEFGRDNGFNPNITLKRTKTLMEGEDCCDFRYRVLKNEEI